MRRRRRRRRRRGRRGRRPATGGASRAGGWSGAPGPCPHCGNTARGPVPGRADRVPCVEGELSRPATRGCTWCARGDGPLPLIVLHGGPGLDHTEFGHWLRPARRRLHAAPRRPARPGPLGPRAAGDVDIGHWPADVDGAGRRARPRALRRPRPLLRRVRRAAARRRAADPARPRRSSARGVPAGPLPGRVERRRSPASSPRSCASRSSTRGRARRTPARRSTSSGSSPTSCPSTSPTRATRASTTCSPRCARAATRRRSWRGAPTAGRRAGPRGAPRARSRHPLLVLAGRHDRVCPSPPPRRSPRACRAPSCASWSTAPTWASSRSRPAYRDAVRGFLARAAAGLRPGRPRALARGQDLVGRLLGGVELLLDERQPGGPEARVGEVEPGDRGQVLRAARAAGGQQLEVARARTPRPPRGSGRRPTAPGAARRRRRRRSPACAMKWGT